MTYERPGRAVRVTATKAVKHGAPCVELKLVGIAVKTAAAAWSAGYSANSNRVEVGETFTIRTKGIVQVDNTGISGAAKGDAIYIAEADNTLSTAAGAGKVTLGRVVELPADNRGVPTGKLRIDLDQKDSV